MVEQQRVQKLQRQALSAWQDGNYRLALQHWGKALPLAPQNLFSLLGAGCAAAELGREQAATAAIGAAFSEPQLARAWNNSNAPDIWRRLSFRGNEILRDIQLARHRKAWRKIRDGGLDEKPDPLLQGALDTFHGLASHDLNHPLQRPEYLRIPGLEARPFWSASDFSGLDALAECTKAITQEWNQLVEDGAILSPYVPESQKRSNTWAKMAGSTVWSAYHLWKGGAGQQDALERCPSTARALEAVDMADIPHHAPEAFFSLLRPGAHIPPHFGLSNAKLAVHLPLIIPDHCAIVVGGEQRGWNPGSCLVFDDSFEHEAWNRSGEPRVVLILEVWHPHLSADQRAAIQQMFAVTQAWRDELAKITPEAATACILQLQQDI